MTLIDDFAVLAMDPAQANLAFQVITDRYDYRRSTCITTDRKCGAAHFLSDAAKLSLLVKQNVDAPRLLSPTEQDVRSAKRFLDETVTWINERVGNRLAELLTRIHGDNPLAFVAQERADLVTNQFSIALTVAGAVGLLT